VLGLHISHANFESSNWMVGNIIMQKTIHVVEEAVKTKHYFIVEATIASTEGQPTTAK